MRVRTGSDGAFRLAVPGPGFWKAVGAASREQLEIAFDAEVVLELLPAG